MYDRRITPVCVSELFERMEEQGSTRIFEETYEYSHSEPWTICYNDFYNIRKALQGIRGDTLEAFILASSQVLAERKAQQVILSKRESGILHEQVTGDSEKEWSLPTSKRLSEKCNKLSV